MNLNTSISRNRPLPMLFPALMESLYQAGMVVLFSDQTSGTVIADPINEKAVGLYVETFDIQHFKPLDGSITLSAGGKSAAGSSTVERFASFESLLEGMLRDTPVGGASHVDAGSSLGADYAAATPAKTVEDTEDVKQAVQLLGQAIIDQGIPVAGIQITVIRGRA